MPRFARIAASATAFLTALAGTAVAGPAGSALDMAAATPASPLIAIHGCHRNVELGPAGWHYHSGYSCRRIAAPPPRAYRSYGRETYRPYRGPVCRERCYYVGPAKICETKCD